MESVRGTMLNSTLAALQQRSSYRADSLCSVVQCSEDDA